MRLILASQSEWRKKLLELTELPFEVMPADVDERGVEAEEPDELVCTLAALKAETMARQVREERVFGEDGEEGTIVIGADTVISLDNRIIGKPKDREDAKKIIARMAGKTHEVWTGVCVLDVDTGERVVEVDKTEVKFLKMTEKQVEKFLDSKEWMGKAGAYQIQGAMKPYVKDVVGSYTNVIGLPMLVLVDMLEKLGVWVEVEMEEVIAEKLGYRS